VSGSEMEEAMGKGIDLAREDAPLHAAVLDDFKDQLLIVFLKRLGGKVSIPVLEVDSTAGDMLAFSVKDGVFNFETQRMS
jgi:hypothetical protein